MYPGLQNIIPLPNPTCGNHDLNKIAFTLHNNASTKITYFLAYFLEKKNHSFVKKKTPPPHYPFQLLPNPTPENHDLNKFESTLREDDSTQTTYFLGK